MRKLLLVLLTLAPLALPALAQAHPLGNFTTNRHARIELSGDHVYVLYVLDLAEIPTFQARSEVGRLGEGGYASAVARQIAGGLSLAVDGERRPLAVLGSAIAFPEGAGGLVTTRLEVVYDAGAVEAGAPAVLRYADSSFPNRIGWREIVVQSKRGAKVVSASVPSKSRSDELRAYPQGLLESPLDVTRAHVRFTPGSQPGVAPALRGREDLEAPVRVASKGAGGFASLIAEDDLTVGFVLVSLLVAIFWGAAHAFSPGHGKAIVAAYLIGTRGTPRHALYLGLIVTVTHTTGVFALGLVTLALSAFIVPEQLYPWLNLVSALLVVGVGVTVVRWRLRDWQRAKARAAHARAHAHGHHHDHDHGHRHVPSEGGGMRGLVSMGISGGIIPCPTALVVLLAAVSLHRVGYGLVLIVAFSLGLAAAMTGIGLAAISAKRAFSRIDFESRIIRLLPAVSALVIVGFGIAMTVRAIPQIA